MNKKYFIIIQPDDFDCPTTVLNILIYKDVEENIFLHDFMCKETRDIIINLMLDKSIFITYNGDLLHNMLNKFFGMDYKNIISLMDIFAREYGEWNEYFKSYTYKKLSFALEYYARKGVLKKQRYDVNIYNYSDVLSNTVLLYQAIQAYEEKTGA